MCGDETAELGVGFAVHGRRLEFNFKGISHPADDLVSSRIGDGFDFENTVRLSAQ